jgi:hypothetical protein
MEINYKELVNQHKIIIIIIEKELARNIFQK